MATTPRTPHARALVTAALMGAAGMLSGCAETEQPAPGADTGIGQVATPSEETRGVTRTPDSGRATGTSSSDLGPYTAHVREGLAAHAGQQVRLTGEVADLIPSRSALVLTDPQDPEVDTLLVTARYTFTEAEEGTVVEVTGTVREDFTAPVVEEAVEGDEEAGFYDRHLGEPYLDEAEMRATEPAG